VTVARTYEDYLKEAVSLHGDACMGIELGTRMTMSALPRIGIHDPKGEDRKKLIVFVEVDRCATDAIMAITGCRPGKRTMKVLDYGKMAATFINLETGKAVRVCPNPAMKKLSSKGGQGNAPVGEIPEEELLLIQEVHVDLRPEDLPGKPLRTCSCEQCGEKIMDGREVEQGGRILCRPCSQKNHYYHSV
jgi:formylmethanofuran dehydrogenase subunit E